MTNVEKLNKIASLAEQIARKDKREKFLEVLEIYKDLETIKELAREITLSIEIEGDYLPLVSYEVDQL